MSPYVWIPSTHHVHTEEKLCSTWNLNHIYEYIAVRVHTWIWTSRNGHTYILSTSPFPAGHYHMISTWRFSMQNGCLSHGNAMWKRNPSCGHHVGCVGEQHEFLAIHMILGYWVGYAWGMLGHGLLWKSCWCHVQRRKKGGGATPIFPMGISCCKMVIHMTKPGKPQNPAWEIHVVKWLSTWQNQERHKTQHGDFML